MNKLRKITLISSISIGVFISGAYAQHQPVSDIPNEDSTGLDGRCWKIQKSQW